MARYNHKDLFDKTEYFFKLAQDADEEDNDPWQNDEDEDPEEIMRQIQVLKDKLRRKQPQSRSQPQPQLKQRSPQSQQQQQPPQTPETIIYDGLKKDVYSALVPAGQAIKGTFNQDIFNQITKIFGDELFDKGMFRGAALKMISDNRIRLGVTVTANTSADSNVGISFWATDTSFTSKFPQQAAAVQQKLNQEVRNIIFSSIQTAAQIAGITQPTKAPIVINSYFSVTASNDNKAVYAQL